MRAKKIIQAMLFAAFLVPAAGVLASSGASLNQLACASGVYCRAGMTPTEAQIVLNLTEQQAQADFIAASQDWPDTAWRCAAGGRTCGAVAQSDAQILIGLPEEAYGQAEQLRERGVTREKDADPTTKAKPAPSPPIKPSIAVENLPPAGPGDYREVVIPQGAASGDIQPLDGHWLVSTGSPKAAGCMAGIAQSLSGKMPAPQSGPIVFETPFRASQMLKHPSISWRRGGPNHHDALITQGRKAMVMSYDLRVNNPSQMTGNSVVTVNIPGQPVCTITTPFSYHRQAS